MSKGLVEKFRNIATAATAGVISFASMATPSQANAEADAQLASFNDPAQTEQASMFARAREYSDTHEGVGIIIYIGTIDQAFLKANGMTPDDIGRKYEAALAEYGVESKSFYEIGELEGSGVGFDLGELTFKDRVTGKSTFSLTAAYAATHRVAADFKALKEYLADNPHVAMN